MISQLLFHLTMLKLSFLRVLIAVKICNLFKCFTVWSIDHWWFMFLIFSHVTLVFFLFIAGVTNYHKLSCSIEHKFIILQFYRPELQWKSRWVKIKVFAELPSSLRLYSRVHFLAFYKFRRAAWFLTCGLSTIKANNIHLSEQTLL